MAVPGVVLSQPPRVKVLEALSSIADGRVKIVGDKEAIVSSSLGDRQYGVYVDVEREEAFSDDNGTKYRGYVGYPIIAFLMLKGVLPYEERIARALAGIPWKELNERYKRYAVVENIVKGLAASRGVGKQDVDGFISSVLARLSELQLRYVEHSQ